MPRRLIARLSIDLHRERQSILVCFTEGSPVYIEDLRTIRWKDRRIFIAPPEDDESLSGLYQNPVREELYLLVDKGTRLSHAKIVDLRDLSVSRIDIAAKLDRDASLVDIIPAHIGGADSQIVVIDVGGNIRSFEMIDGALVDYPHAPIENTYYIDEATACVVTKKERTPFDPIFRLSGRSKGKDVDIDGAVTDARGSKILVVKEGDDGNSLHVCDLGSNDRISYLGPRLNFVDARFALPGQVLASVHDDACQRVVVLRLDDLGLVRELDGNGAVQFASGNLQGYCFKRVGLLSGSNWHVVGEESDRRIPGRVAEFPNAEECGVRLSSGASLIAFAPKGERCRSGIISLHGGPESCEWNDIRYGGLYRALLASGYAIFALNYRGSSSFGAALRVSPHGRWQETFRDDIDSALEWIWGGYELSADDLGVLGGSFGGTLALMVGARLPAVRRIVAISPVTDLAAHVADAEARSDGGGQYTSWFSSRFGNEIKFFDHTCFLTSRAETHLICGEQDDVVDYRPAVELVRKAKERGLPWSLWLEPGLGHVPKDVDQTEARFSRVFQLLTA